ncbi:MAG: hypothetical protein KDE02_18070 [Rhodobacteraceae bacterium]|nr:hypothetical protein [Paracoccaceae bacterium]MCB2144569.1 hypothetical protein [Paracoccaceae bacterium]
MDRRSFNSGLVAIGAASAIAVDPAAANQRDKDTRKRVEEEFARAFLRLPAFQRALVIDRLLVVAGELVLSYNMQQQWQRFALSRADVGVLPLIGGLTRPTVHARLARMNLIGRVFIAQATLILLLDIAFPRPPKKMTIVNDDNEFTSKAKPEPKRVSNFDIKPYKAKLKKDAGAYFDPKTGELIALIPPHLRLK